MADNSAAAAAAADQQAVGDDDRREEENVGLQNAEEREDEQEEEEEEEEEEEKPWETPETKRLFRVYCTVRSMLANRGYGLVETGEESAVTADIKFLEDDVDPMTDIVAFYERTKGTTREVERGKMRIEATRGDLRASATGEAAEGAHEKIVVYFEDKVTGMERVSQLEEAAKKIPNISRMIIISRLRTALLQRTIDHINNDPDRVVYVEHFKERELLLDITTHVLVPSHKVLSPMETKELLDRYKINSYQLPKIQHVDPVARYFGLQPGDVVKISRCVCAHARARVSVCVFGRVCGCALPACICNCWNLLGERSSRLSFCVWDFELEFHLKRSLARPCSGQVKLLGDM